MTQALRSGPNGIALQFSANAVDDNAAEKAIAAEMILSVALIYRALGCVVPSGWGYHFQPR